MGRFDPFFFLVMMMMNCDDYDRDDYDGTHRNLELTGMHVCVYVYVCIYVFFVFSGMWHPPDSACFHVTPLLLFGVFCMTTH